MPPIIIPPLVKWTLGALGAAAVVHWVVKEVRRVNAELDRAEFFPQRKIDVIRHIAKETERQMHLSRVDPAHTVNVRINTCKQLTRWLRQIDRNEETLSHNSKTAAPTSSI